MSEDRLQKILARAGVASRRHAEELIAGGRVTVNGRVAAIGDKADAERDAIKLDGKRVEPRRASVYLLLNKPRAVMSTVADPEGRPTVLELVPPALRKAVVPVGRLDFMTEGLILLTDDGELAQRVAHPRYGCGKTYEAKVRGEPAAAALDKLRAGIVLDGRRTAPAKITRRKVPGTAGRRPGGEESGNSWWTVELSEGRTRQIREMFTRIGHPVTRLRRVSIGPLTDRRLPLGGLRELTEREVEALRRATDPSGAGGAKPKSRVGWAKPKSAQRTGAKRVAGKAAGEPRSAAKGKDRRGAGNASRAAGPGSGRRGSRRGP